MVGNILDFFITSAHADAVAAAPAASSGGGTQMMIILGAFVVIMYFLQIRPQSKRAKEQRALMSSLAKGDEVMMTSGMLGRIVKLTDNYVVIAISDTTEVTFQKSAIVNALPKGTLKSIQ
jgi:preprotein translocase subunit YajC